jgi:nucleoside-diphosphate kinase
MSLLKKIMSNFEQTLSIIKPDAVERNLVEEIKRIFTSNNLKIKESKKIQISKEEAAEFYKVHQSKPFYENLCSYLSSGPIVAMILEGENAILENRKLMGATDPKKAEENTIRKLYGISIDKNSVHGSDSSENAKKEINFFFKN